MHKHPLPLIAALLTTIFPAYAAVDEDQPDLSRWRCRFCPFESGLDGSLELGFGLAFEDAYRFGSGTGLEDDGLYLLGDMALVWWGEDARFYELDAEKLGTRARALTLTGGVQGRYVFNLSYDELAFRRNDTGLTPFTGIGSATLTLPAGWQTAGNTQLMPDLASALKPIELGVDRKQLGFGLRLNQGTRLTHEFEYSRTTRHGLGAHSGSFLTLSSILPAAIDYETDSVLAALSYTAPQWQTRLAYEHSFFSNDNALIGWQNPFNPLVAGADNGLAARPPDNDFKQLSLTGNYRSLRGVTLVGSVAIGEASQDELLAAYTSNALLPAVSLPAPSADGRVESSHINASGLLSGNWGRNLRYKAFYRRHERDNRTPARGWQLVVTDVFQDDVRRNLPFSFEKEEIGANLRVRIEDSVRASFGFEREDYQRDLQEVSETTENSYWAKLTATARDAASISFKVRRQNRNGSGYRPVDSLSPPENPLLRKYNLADRDRSQLAAQINLDLNQRVGVSLSGEYSKDDYPDSAIGLRASEDRSLTADASYVPIPRLGLNAFLTRQTLDFTQVGRSNGADWMASGRDRFVTGGINLRLQGEDGRKRLLLDYSRSDSRGSSDINAGPGNFAFPELSADLEVFSLSFSNQIRANLRARLSYQYERYHSRDWQIEGVTPTTIGSVLTFGESLPNYTQQLVWLGFTRAF